jgi:archaellum component FlaF (FlaF/FlaG flagellin family)
MRNGTIILFWSQRQTTAFNLYYERFSVNQFTGIGAWSSSVHLTTLTTFNDTAPAATVGRDGTMWLFWERSNQSCTTTCSQTKQLYYETLKNGSWSSATKITTDTNWNSLPSVVVTKDGLVRLAWTKAGQSSGSSSIYYKTLNGTVWSNEIPITAPPSGFGDQRPSMIQDRNGTIWLFWSRTSLTAPMFIIYSKFDTNNGQTLASATETQMTFEGSGVDSQQPAAVQANGVTVPVNGVVDKTIHLFYSSDRTNFDYDIWSLVSPSISPIHDVGLTSPNIPTSIMYAGGLASIGQSSNATFGVTVVNYGDFGENVQATVTVSNTTTISLGSQTQALSRGTSVSFFFQWNTTNAKPGRYNLRINAFPNNSTENSIWLLPWGDVDQDGNVVLGDVSVFFYDFGFTPATPSRWNPFCDINNNGIIDIIDVGVAVRNFGIYT